MIDTLIDATIAGGLAGYGVAVPVGAIAAVIVSLTARTSLIVGLAAALGAATADGIYAAVAVLGGAAVAQAVAPITSVLRWVAALVLVGLAARVAVTAVRAVRAEPAVRADITSPASPGRAYVSLLGLTLLNPATVIYFVALVLGSRPGGWSGGPAVVFVSAAFVASASWQLLLAGGGRVVGRVLTGRRGRLGTALVSSAVITVLAIGLVAGG